jgi:hypothetical protein
MPCWFRMISAAINPTRSGRGGKLVGFGGIKDRSLYSNHASCHIMAAYPHPMEIVDEGEVASTC